jgi:hypothetical protein
LFSYKFLRILKLPKLSLRIAKVIKAVKILKFISISINGTFAFARPLNPALHAKAKEPFIG